jgi:hypothetical protein
MANSITSAEDIKVDEQLQILIGFVEESEEATADARLKSERDRDYYDGKQWTEEEVAELNKRKQPVVTANLIKRKMDFLHGLEKQQRSDPRAFPREPGDEDSADAATNALRFVADNNSFAKIKSEVWDNITIEGYGGAEIVVERKGPDRGRLLQSTFLTPDVRFEVVVKRWRWDRILYDPHSRESDFRDARYFGHVIWMDQDQALARWPGKEDIITQTFSQEPLTDTFEDVPDTMKWADRKRKRIMVIQMYYKKGPQWHWCIFSRGGKFKSGVVPYLDHDGESQCPVELVSAYCDREGNRYGVVRELISPQDEVNKRRSKSLHLLTMRQIVYDKAGIRDPRMMRQEMAKPDGAIEVQFQDARFEILQNQDQTQGHLSLMQDAKSDIEQMGPSASLTGKSDREESGRALLARQQGGLTELSNPLDNLADWEVRCYKQMWSRVKQYWNEERWFRVTGNEDKYKFVVVNQQVTRGQEVLAQMQANDASEEQIAYAEGQMQFIPESQEVVRIANDIASVDVDIIIEDVPDTITIQQEQFAELVELAKAGIQFPPKIYLAASQVHNKRDLIEMLDGQDNEQAKAQEAAQQVIQQSELADIEAKNAKTGLAEAQVIKIKAETAEIIDQTQADTQLTLAKTEEALAKAAKAYADARRPTPSA